MTYALMNKAVVTIYGRPDYDDLTEEGVCSFIQDEGLYGMPVEILEEVNAQWVKVRTHYRYEGYVPVKDLYFISEEACHERKDETLRFVIKGHADVLSLPKVQGIRLMLLTRGAIVRIVSEAESPGGWVKVSLNDGTQGYMKEGFLAPYYSSPSSADEMTLRKNLADTARLYLDTQYRWGGKSPEGIDCSGLCSMAYLLNGITIFRDARIKEGFPVHEIKFSERKIGDLLYFPGHIAMLISEDEYIHSTGHDTSDGVVINSLNKEHPLYRADLAEKLYAVGSVFQQEENRKKEDDVMKID